MARLIIKLGKEKGQIFNIQDQGISIGRNESNQIVLSDRRVSRNHAKIVVKNDHYFLEDLGSVNGTKVNDKEVKQQALHYGDKIKVGDTVLEFASEDASINWDEEEKTDKNIKVDQLAAEGLTVELKIPAEAVLPLEESLNKTDAESTQKAYQKLKTLYTISHEIGSVLKLGDLLNRILKIILDVLKADRSFILLIDETTGEMFPQYVHNREGLGEKTDVAFSRTIANHVLNTGESILTSDAKGDNRFMEAQSVIHHGIRSTLCVPLKAKGQILGIIHVDTKDRILGFAKEDLELLTAICNQASIAIENAKLFDNLRKANKELFDQQNQLVEAAKLSALGLLASGMVHEINNPLHGISMCNEMTEELLQKGKLEEADVKQCLEYEVLVKDKVKHCQNIVKNLLAFARRKEVEMLPTNVNKSVDAALIIAQFHMSKTKVHISKRLKEDLPKVKADASQLQQVYLNMIINAMDAMEVKGGSLDITSCASEGKWVDVLFKDTGHGIPKDKFVEIFKPLYTTKPEGKGTGLGLAISKDIVDKHQGQILVDSAVGVGTTFTIRLPIYQEPPK
ncbi:MAG TPA: ATP-binding protein [Candidatus Omnitrophota bacterium]|nr:ATP-binding protein [Candidatus Omnitrophota bacterium]